MASDTFSSKAEKIVYPQECTSDKSRKKYKQQLLRNRPETLFADEYETGKICNLIFHTDHQQAWRSAIYAHYRSLTEEPICNGFQLTITDAKDTVEVTVNIYTNGTVMVQGNFRRFEQDFDILKERAQQERSSPNTDTHSTSTPTSSTSDEPPKSEPSDTVQDQDPQLSVSIVCEGDSHRRELQDDREIQEAQLTALEEDMKELRVDKRE